MQATGTQQKVRAPSSSRRKSLSHSEIENFLKDLTLNNENIGNVGNTDPVSSTDEENGVPDKQYVPPTMEETIRSMCKVMNALIFDRQD